MEKSIFHVASGDLLHALQKVNRAVLTKATLPMYTCILFELRATKLSLTGSTTEIQIETDLEVIEPSADITFLMDASIVKILETLPDQPVEFEVTLTPAADEKKTDTVRVELRHSKGNISIPGMDAALYNKLKDVTGNTIEIPVEKLNRALNFTEKFAGKDTSKPTQAAIYFDMKPDSIVFVSTNGTFLSRFEDKTLSGGNAESFILGTPTANILSNLIGKLTDLNVSVTTNPTNISFSFGNIKVTSRLTEGRYPKYDSIFPKNNEIEITVDSTLFSSTVKRLLTAVSPLANLIILETGMLETRLSAQEKRTVRSAAETIDTAATAEITIGFSGPELTDILSVITAGAHLTFSTPMRPILIKPEKDEENTDLTLLLMPMVIND